MRNKSQKHCPTCEKAIPADAPDGFCPSCLLGVAHENSPLLIPAPDTGEVGQAFPQLTDVELIGQGGMGFVYKAHQLELNRHVALKILSPELGKDPAFRERFVREARILGKLSHPRIVTIYEHGENEGFFYLMMEYVDGVNLREAMSAQKFTPEQALAIIPDICDALQSAHDQGVWHRDIKPENILLDQDGQVKIADFGIARIVGDRLRNYTLTATGNALGSAPYMSPEQHENPHKVDHRADIYSLGVVLYEMLTGELPLGRFPVPSERSTVDHRIDELVLKTLEKERELRQQSAAQIKTDIAHAGRNKPEQSTASHGSMAPISLRGILCFWSGIVLAIAAGNLTRGNFQGGLLVLAAVLAVVGLVQVIIALAQIRRGEIAPGLRNGLRLSLWLPILLAVLAFGLRYNARSKFPLEAQLEERAPQQEAIKQKEKAELKEKKEATASVQRVGPTPKTRRVAGTSSRRGKVPRPTADEMMGAVREMNRLANLSDFEGFEKLTRRSSLPMMSLFFGEFISIKEISYEPFGIRRDAECLITIKSPDKDPHLIIASFDATKRLSAISESPSYRFTCRVRFSPEQEGALKILRTHVSRALIEKVKGKKGLFDLHYHLGDSLDLRNENSFYIKRALKELKQSLARFQLDDDLELISSHWPKRPWIYERFAPEGSEIFKKSNEPQ